MNSSELKAIAKQKMEGKTTNLVVMTLIYVVIIGACNYIYSPLSLIVLGPLSLGFAIVGLKVLGEEQPEIVDIFSGFYNFGTALVLYLVNTLFTFLWTLLLIIPGIVKSYSYSMSYFILADHPELSATQARERSIEMMEGNKMRLFKLHLSFIGWYLLSILTFGILLLWVMPRVQVATAAFYEEISGRRSDSSSDAEEEPAAEAISDEYITVE